MTKHADKGTSNMGKSLLGTVFLTIAAVPGIGFSTVLALLHRQRKGPRTTPNDRGQYGK